MKRINVKWALLFIFILSLGLRIFIVVNQDESKRLPLSDAKQYDIIAMNIVSNFTFSDSVNDKKIPIAQRPPMYPLFLAGIYAVFGHNYITVKIIQAFIGALVCMIIFIISKLLYDNTSAALTASFLTAVYKPFTSGFVVSSDYSYGGPAYLLSEYLYMFMIAASLMYTMIFIKTKIKRFAILSGVFIGMAILTRAEFVVFPVLLFVLFIMAHKTVRGLLRQYMLICLFIALAIVPWVLRNYLVFKKFIPLTTYSGFVFWMGNNSMAQGGWAFPADYQETKNEIEGFSEYERNKAFLKKAIGELKENPGRMPWLIVKKIMVHWAPFEMGFNVFNPYYAFILLFGAVGILFFRNCSISENIALALILTTTVNAMIIYGDPRYRYPYEFLLVIFAARGLNGIYKRFLHLKI